MPIVLNCENEPCPNPVLRCKRLLDEQTPKMMDVIVDNEAAMDNVSRYLASKGMRIDETRKDGTLWTIKASSQDQQASAAQASQAPQAPQAPQGGQENTKSPDASKILVFLTADTMGSGDDTLGSNFRETLIDGDDCRYDGHDLLLGPGPGGGWTCV